MSEQPPSSAKATADRQEWTVERIRMYSANIATSTAEKLATDISATLTAETDRFEGAKRGALKGVEMRLEIKRLEKELVAEREKNKAQVNTFRLLEDALGIVNPDEHTEQLFIAIANLKEQQQLATEREHVKQLQALEATLQSNLADEREKVKLIGDELLHVCKALKSSGYVLREETETALAKVKEAK